MKHNKQIVGNIHISNAYQEGTMKHNKQIVGNIHISNAKVTMNDYGQNTISGDIVLTDQSGTVTTKEDVLNYCRSNNCLSLRVIEELKLYEVMTPHEIAEIAVKNDK